MMKATAVKMFTEMVEREVLSQVNFVMPNNQSYYVL